MKKTKAIAKESKREEGKTTLLRTSTLHHEQIIKTISVRFQTFEERFEAVDVSSCLVNSQFLSTKKLIRLLEQKFQISSQNRDLKYYLEDGAIWLFCPKNNISIDIADILAYPQIKLELKQSKELIDAVMENSGEESNSENFSDEEAEGELKCRRLKERKIKHVIEKVLRWRQLYAGVSQEESEVERVSLEEGARMVKISKKTLDDYLSQIKKGKKYGFNFNEHKNEKVGVLREYIRKMERNKNR